MQLSNKPQFSREKLPLIKLLPHFLVNIEELQNEVRRLSYDRYDEYNDLSPEGEYRFLCNQNENIHRKFLTDGEQGDLRGESFKQLALTSFNYDKYPDAKFDNRVLHKTRSVRLASDPGRSDYLPLLDERNYNVPNQKCSPLFRKLLGQFKSPFSRVRLAALMPGFEGEPHIDYNTDYSIRVHVPIFTNEDVFFFYDDKNRGQAKLHMPADGRAWCVNTGYRHFVANYGQVPRLHLVICLLDQSDIWTAEELRELPTN